MEMRCTLTDIVSPKKRSEMMAGIRGKNTKPEMRVRKALFAVGYRYRLHRKDLPGTPDIVLPGRMVAIFVNGCFWHGHNDCSLAKIPRTRRDFWQEKLEHNRQRDKAATEALTTLGWRVLVIWECFIRSCKEQHELERALSSWLEDPTRQDDLRSSKTTGLL